MIRESRWHTAFRHKLKGQEQSDCTWTAHQPGILNSVKFPFFFLEDILLWVLFIFRQYLSSYLYDIMLHYCNVCLVRCTHHTCLDVPVGSLEPCRVYSPPFQVATKWTHLILFPRFSLNLFSCIIKSSIFLRDKGGPCSLFQGLTLMTAATFEYVFALFSTVCCLCLVTLLHGASPSTLHLWFPRPLTDLPVISEYATYYHQREQPVSLFLKSGTPIKLSLDEYAVVREADLKFGVYRFDKRISQPKTETVAEHPWAEYYY